MKQIEIVQTIVNVGNQQRMHIRHLAGNNTVSKIAWTELTLIIRNGITLSLALIIVFEGWVTETYITPTIERLL